MGVSVQRLHVYVCDLHLHAPFLLLPKIFRVLPDPALLLQQESDAMLDKKFSLCGKHANDLGIRIRAVVYFHSGTEVQQLLLRQPPRNEIAIPYTGLLVR